MKKYLLLIENEELWEKFKKVIDKDINSEIISLIQEKSKSLSFSPVSKNLKKQHKDFLIEQKLRTASFSEKILGRKKNGK